MSTTATRLKNLFLNRTSAMIVGTLVGFESKYDGSGNEVKVVRITAQGAKFTFPLYGDAAKSFNPAQGASVQIEAEGFLSQEGLENPTDVIALNKVKVINVMPKSAGRPEYQSFDVVAQIGKFEGAVRSGDRQIGGETKHVTNLKLGLSGKDRDGNKGYVNFETALWDRAGLDQYLTPGSMIMIKHGRLTAKVNEDSQGRKHVNVTINGNPDLVPTGQTPSETDANAATSSAPQGGSTWGDSEIPF